MATLHPAQLDPFALSGAGAVTGATSFTLKSFTDIDGTALTMSDFGSVGYGTLDPGNGSLEEQVSFTGVVQNSNGTATLSGVKSVTFLTPYTETSGLAKTHAGSTAFVISNTSGFYNQFPAKVNDEVITGQWTFTNTPIVPGTVSAASTTVAGVSKLSLDSLTPLSPIVAGDNDPRLVGYGASSGGTDTYAITVSADITAYTTGQMFAFKADVANTGAATLNVNGIGAKTIKKNVSSNLEDGDIQASQDVLVIYDGTNFQLLSRLPTTNVQTFITTGANTWTKPTGAKSVLIQLIGGGCGGQGGTGAGNANSAKGGGSGKYASLLMDASLLSSTVTVTVGAGSTGTAGTSGSSPGTTPSPGGATTFGSYLTAAGGVTNSAANGFVPGTKGADGPSVASNGTAGTDSVFNSNLTGGTAGTGAASSNAGNGGDGASATANWPEIGGTGGSGGGPNNGGNFNGGNGGNGGKYGAGAGAGGAGATTTGVGGTGGNGADGIAVVTTFF